jgi:fatty-acyl-CoA synthase
MEAYMPSIGGPFDTGLDKNPANHVPLTPLTFIAHAAAVYPERTAVVHGPTRRSWSETWARCQRLASALTRAGVGPGDTVAFLAANTPELYEAHFGVPLAGAVLNAINTRFDPGTVSFILEHGEAKVLITDREFSRTVARVLPTLAHPPLVIDIDDPTFDGGELLGSMDYEAFLATGDPAQVFSPPAEEWQAITLNYTSGTTGRPKGIVYHHRGAYLNALSNLLLWNMGPGAVYLWTLPMFHCNGWCFPWTLAAVAGTSVCLRSVRVERLFELIKAEKVTHLCGAPVVLQTLIAAPEALRRGIEHPVQVLTGASAPPPAVLEGIERLGFEVTHGYGLTESFGAATYCAWQPQWAELSLEQRALRKSRQGVPAPALEALMVADPVTLAPVPRDGAAIGEIFLRGNTLMMGYLKNPAATAESFAGGWYHTGDLAVWHPDGYIEIKDRSKDIIISGGENISSLEVESLLARHPAVLEAAVVAGPDPKWGESPCAFITLRPGATVDERDIVAFCRQHLAHYKVPKSVVFGELPRTATGKIHKQELRERAKSLSLLI